MSGNKKIIKEKQKREEFEFDSFNTYLKKENIPLMINDKYQLLHKIDKKNYEEISNFFIRIQDIVEDYDVSLGDTTFDCYFYFVTDDDDDTENGGRYKAVWQYKFVEEPETLYILSLSKLVKRFEKCGKINNKSLFKWAMELYTEFQITHFAKNYWIYSATLGWQIDNEGIFFLGINEESPTAYFNTNFRLWEEERQDFEEIKICKANQTIYEVIENNPELAIVINYIIFSLTVRLFTEQIEKIYESEGIKIERFLFPGLSIHGTNKVISRNTFVNIFCNLFEVNYFKLNSINSGIHIALDSSKYISKEYRHIHDVPILVYTSKGINKSNMGYVKKILREQDIYHPIFVCYENLNLNQNIEFDLSAVSKISVEKDNLKNIQESIDMIIKDYILYVQRMGIEKLNSINEEGTRSIIKKYWYDDTVEDLGGHFLCLLLAAQAWFNEYLRFKDFNELKNSFDQYLETALLKQFRCKDLPTSNTLYPIQQFKKYIKSIFIEKTWDEGSLYIHWEGIEKSGRKEACYYIDGNLYFADFCKFCNTKISQAELNKMLKTEGVVKLRTDGSSMVLPRTYNGKKHNVLVILKDKIEEMP